MPCISCCPVYLQVVHYTMPPVLVEIVCLIKPQMGTRIHRNASSEPLTTLLPWTMRSRQDVLFNFGSFWPKFGCHGNSLGSLEISDSMFEIADPENPTIHAKFVSISCTEMKLCLFECLLLNWVLSRFYRAAWNADAV